MVNATRKYFAVVRMNGNSEAGLDADGHGAVWLLGYGMGSPSIKDEFNWDFSTAYCVAEISPKVYQFTGKTGAEGSTVIGERIRYDYISVKYLGGKSWDQQFHQRTCKWIRLPGTYSMLRGKSCIGLSVGTGSYLCVYVRFHSGDR